MEGEGRCLFLALVLLAVRTHLRPCRGDDRAERALAGLDEGKHAQNVNDHLHDGVVHHSHCRNTMGPHPARVHGEDGDRSVVVVEVLLEGFREKDVGEFRLA